MSVKISRCRLCRHVRPHDRRPVRLADTDLIIEVEKDFTIYGEEVKFGGGKVIRDGMGQSQVTSKQGAVDTVITNALILDHWGIVKADIGIKDGKSSRSARPAIRTSSRASTIIIGPGTEVIAGEGKIVTAGGFDSHIHFICPQQVDDALMSGVTTLLGGGTGPAHGTFATTCTPGPWHHRPHDPGGRRVAGQSRHCRQGQCVAARRRWRKWSRAAPARSSCTRTGARRRPRSTIASRSPTITTCR